MSPSPRLPNPNTNTNTQVACPGLHLQSAERAGAGCVTNNYCLHRANENKSCEHASRGVELAHMEWHQNVRFVSGSVASCQRRNVTVREANLHMSADREDGNKLEEAVLITDADAAIGCESQLMPPPPPPAPTGQVGCGSVHILPLLGFIKFCKLTTK